MSTHKRMATVDSISEKRCSRCRELKPSTGFCRNKNTRDGLNSWCKKCVKVYYRRGELSQAYIDVPEGCKRCAKCQQIRPLSNFNKHRSAKDGLDTYCRDCKFIIGGYKKRKISPSEGVPDGFRRCLRCKIVFPASTDFFSKAKNAAGLRATCKVCQSVLWAEWYKTNTEYARAASRKFKADNPNHVRERNKRYRHTHPERIRVFKSRREDRKRSRTNDLSDEQWVNALQHFGGCCAVCGRPPGLWHIIAMDHWIPLSSPDCPGTIVTNIIPLCHGVGGCNNSKKDRMPSAWLLWKFGKREARVIEAKIMAYLKGVQ